MRLVFKVESDRDGLRLGPITFGEPQPRPFNPERQPDPWFTESQAEYLAAQLGADLLVTHEGWPPPC